MSYLTLWEISAKGYDGGSPASCLGGSVAKVHHERRPRQHRAHHLALHADSASMNDAEGFKSGRVRFQQIFFNHALDVARGNAVEVEDVRNGNSDRFGLGIWVH